MKKSFSGFWIGLTVVFLALIYSVILLLLKPDFDTASWILYGATIIAFLLVAVQAVAAARGGSAVITETALGLITVIYFGLQFIFGGIVCMCIRDVPATPVLVVEIILLAIYLAIVFVMNAAQSSSAKQDRNDKNAVQKLRILENSVQTMIENTDNPVVKKALSELAEDIHYSDTVSFPALAVIEDKISQNLAILGEELSDANADPVSRVETIRQLLRERDHTAAILKG